MSKKLLLADDSVVIQKLVGLSFANEDVEIIATDNGDDAVRIAREIVPDVILADVVMPGKSGYEVCEAIKQDPALAHIPVLLLTGTFETFDEARAESSGANGQITKPFEAQSLVTRVIEVLAAAVPAAPVSDEGEPAVGESDLFDANMTSLATDDLLAENDLSIPDLSSESDSDSQEAIRLQAPESSISESQMADLASPAPVRADAFDVSEVTDPLPPPSGVQQSAEDYMLSDPGESRSALFGGSSPLGAKNASSAGSSPGIGESPKHVAKDGPPDLPPDQPRVEEATIVSNSVSSRDDADLLDDPLSGLSEDFGLHDAVSMPDQPREHERDSRSADSMSAVSAVDVDTALAAGAPDTETTILVGERDSNSQTSPNSTPFARLSLESSVQKEDLATKIELNPALDSVPELPPAFSPSPEVEPTAVPAPPVPSAVQVTDLDAKLAEPVEDAADLTDLGLDESSGASGVDLDFAFDVSEQQPADMDDPLNLSYTSLSEPAAQSSAASDLEPENSLSEPLNPLAGDYDVSVSDVSVRDVSVSDVSVRDASESDVSTSDVSISEPVPSPVHPASPAPIPLSDTPLVTSAEGISIDDVDDVAVESVEGSDSNDDLLIGVSVEAESQPVADLSPMMEQQIQETLEKVAWEAFSDLSEAIVKQVMDRVEKIAWEVIPQMAETLVREEIRRMKDDKD